MAFLSEGQVLRGTYEVERLLGEGAFGEVYRVKHRFLGRQAMKVFKAVGMTPEETEEMLGEAILLSRLGHPNIVRVFDANVLETDLGTCGFFTMEYVAGGTLEQFWRSYGARFMPVETAVDVVRQACQGLAVAHGEKPPIVHRDIKPTNLLIGYDAAGLRVRVSDFGLAKRVNPLTMTASAKGTPSFKAPEALQDPQADSCAGDVWSLGATLYLLLTDRLPYAQLQEASTESESQERTARVAELPERRARWFERPLPPPSQRNGRVDSTLDRLVLRALSPKPQERFIDAKGLLAALEAWKPSHEIPRRDPQVDPMVTTKLVLGARTPADDQEARRMASEAVALARESGRLTEAADLLEEAMTRCPDLRTQYEYQLQLWRRGIAM